LCAWLCRLRRSERCRAGLVFWTCGTLRSPGAAIPLDLQRDHAQMTALAPCLRRGIFAWDGKVLRIAA